VVAATLASVAAATLPTEALADDGTASVPATPAAAPSLDPGAVLAGEASAAVEGAVGDALDAVAQATEPAAATESTATDASSAAPVVEPAPAAEAAPVRASQPDTMPVSSDTAAGIAATAPTTSPTTATAVQASPTNVNVSVRIGSPGDNGAVTQVNVAAAVASGAAPERGGGTSAATSVAPASTPSAAPLAAQSTAGSATSAQDASDTWNWQWNCLSKPDLSGISTTGSVPKNWTWIWNCANNTTQYQDATASQYQPSNTNISIRISSPGNDGPVSQANVAVAAAVGSIVAAKAAAGSVVAIAAPAPGLDVVSDVIPAVTSLPALAEQARPIWLGDDASVPSIVELVDDTVGLQFTLVPLFRGVGPGAAERQTVMPAARGLAVPTFGGRSAIGTLAAAGDTYETVPALGSASGRSADSGATASGVAEKPVPRWRAPPKRPVPVGASSGASFAPATGGSASGGGIPIFLVLPFLAAMLDLARRVTLDRAALPSGYRSRMPDDPG
jgi:hypothetical protein